MTRGAGILAFLLWLLVVGGAGGGRVGSGWTVLGGELAVPCTRNPL